MSLTKSYPINFKEITANLEFYEEVLTLHKKAENYLLGFYWCQEIKNCFLYTNIGRVFSIYIFEIVNTASVEDDFLWIIVGDIPSMYLNVFVDDTTIKVIENYIDLAQDWINQIKNGHSVAECYPFNAQPTIELAELLQKKISFMRDSVIQNIDDIPFKKIR